MPTLRPLLRTALLFMSVAMTFMVLPGCARPTPENVNRVEKGMSPAQVESLIGAPNDQTMQSALGISTETFHYHTSSGDVTITFVNDQVWVVDANFGK